MAVHLLKLCVGASSVDDLRAWIDFRRAQARSRGLAHEQFHTTRMYPKRAEDIIGKGSLYWVIKGSIQCRQPVLDIRRFTDDEGIGRCDIILQPEITLTRPVPKRPFQGWRYLSASDAPPDLGSADGDLGEMPEDMRAELSGLGLI